MLVMELKIISENELNDEYPEESRSSLTRVILITILFSPLFSSAFIFMIVAGFENKIFYVILMLILLVLSFLVIQYYRDSLKTRELISF